MNHGTDVKELLARYIAADLHNEPGMPIANDADLLASGLLDSLGVMSLVHFIEQECGIAVPAEDILIENFLSLAAIEIYLAGRGFPKSDRGND